MTKAAHHTASLIRQWEVGCFFPTSSKPHSNENVSNQYPQLIKRSCESPASVSLAQHHLSELLTLHLRIRIRRVSIHLQYSSAKILYVADT